MSVVRWRSTKRRGPLPPPAPREERPRRKPPEPPKGVPWGLLRRALPPVGARLRVRVVERGAFRVRGQGIRRVRVRDRAVRVEAHAPFGMVLRGPRYRMFASLHDLADGSVAVVSPAECAERIRAARQALRAEARRRAA